MTTISLDTDNPEFAIGVTSDKKMMILSLEFSKKVMGKIGTMDFSFELEFDKPLPPRICKDIREGNTRVKNLKGVLKI